MPGVMLVKQKVADVAQWDSVFRDPELDAARRAHGLHAPPDQSASFEGAALCGTGV
jgi:hypothetical protein